MPELVLIAEVKGEPVAFSMTLPDANVALKAAERAAHHATGCPSGWRSCCWPRARSSRLRLITLGIKEGYRKRGLDAILYLDTLTHRARARATTGGEISWTLEDNHLVNRAIESMGGKQYKTYRVYERPL